MVGGLTINRDVQHNGEVVGICMQVANYNEESTTSDEISKSALEMMITNDWSSYKGAKDHIKKRIHHHQTNLSDYYHSASLSQSQSQQQPPDHQFTHTISKAIRITNEMTCQQVVRLCQIEFNHVNSLSKGHLLLVVSLPVSREAELFHCFSPSSHTSSKEKYFHYSDHHIHQKKDWKVMQVTRQVQPDESPLLLRNELRQNIHTKFSKYCLPKSLVSAPLVRWYYVAQFVYPHQDYYFLELDGYNTTYDDDSDMDDIPTTNNNKDNNDDDVTYHHPIMKSIYPSHEESSSIITESANVPNYNDDKNDDNNETIMIKKKEELYRYYRYLRKVMIQYVPCEEPFVLSGWLLRQSQSNPYVWKHVYATLLDSTLWIMGRHRKYSSSTTTTNTITPISPTKKNKYQRPRFSTIWTSSSQSLDWSTGKVCQISLAADISEIQEHPPHTFGLKSISTKKWIRFRTPHGTSHALWMQRLQHTFQYSKDNNFIKLAEQQQHPDNDDNDDDGDANFNSHIEKWEMEKNDTEQQSALSPEYNADDFSLKSLGEFTTSTVSYVIDRAMCVAPPPSPP